MGKRLLNVRLMDTLKDSKFFLPVVVNNDFFILTYRIINQYLTYKYYQKIEKRPTSVQKTNV
jgi:hypothetical protein